MTKSESGMVNIPQVSSTEGVFETDGDILVRTARPEDSEVIAEYFIRNRCYLKPWEPEREEAFFTPFSWSKKLIKLHELHKMGLAYYCLIFSQKSGEMLGTISFSNLSRFPSHACSVGYSLSQHVQGRGVMTRALALACTYMFEHQNMHRINASYMPHNTRSASVLQRLGFQIEGEAKDYLLIDGQWQDHTLTSLVNNNWTSQV